MSGSLESLGRLRLHALLLLAVVFVIGGLAGAALDRAVRSGGPHRPPHEHYGEPPPGLPPEIERELALTPEQQARIREIFKRARPTTDAIMDAVLPRLRAITDSVRLEVRGTLNPSQQKLFDRRFGLPGAPLPGLLPSPPRRGGPHGGDLPPERPGDVPADTACTP